MLTVIEHQEIGDLLLVDLAGHIGQGEQPLGHGGKSEKALALVPHDHVVTQMVTRERQCPVSRIPDRHGKRPTQRPPDVVAEPFPGGEQDLRIRPGKTIRAVDTEPVENLISVVKP